MRKRVIVVAMALLFLLTACTIGGFSFGDTQVETGRDVRLEFLYLPTYDLYEGTEFQVGITVTNEISEDVNGYVCIGDLAPDHYGGIPDSGNCESVFLPSAQILSEGDLQPEAKDYVFPSNGGTYFYSGLPADFTDVSTIFAKLNYEVETTTQAPICIKNPSVTNPIKGIACELEETLSGINQPSMPIEVTKIEQHILPSGKNMAKVMLKIYVNIEEEGFLIDYKKLQNAKPSKDAGVDVVAFLGTVQMSCKPLNKGKIIFGQYEERVITCELDTPITQEYLQDVVLIRFHYGFQKEIHDSVILAKEVI